jgi:hypothetical protein
MHIAILRLPIIILKEYQAAIPASRCWFTVLIIQHIIGDNWLP